MILQGKPCGKVGRRQLHCSKRKLRAFLLSQSMTCITPKPYFVVQEFLFPVNFWDFLAEKST